MSFAIVILPKARRQIVRAAELWTQSHLTARTFLDEELDRALMWLADYPELGIRCPWSRPPEVRRLLLRRVEYVVFYRARPRAQRIEVLALWYARRRDAPTR